MTDPHVHPAGCTGPATPVYPNPTAFPPPPSPGPPLVTTEALIAQRNEADRRAADAEQRAADARDAADQLAAERDAARRDAARRDTARQPSAPPRRSNWYTSGRGIGTIIAVVLVIVLLLLCLFGGWGKYVFEKLGLTVPDINATAPATPGPRYTAPAAAPDAAPNGAPAGAPAVDVPSNWVRLSQAQYNETCARRYGSGSTASRLAGSSEWPSYQLRCNNATDDDLYLTEDYCQPHYGPNSRAENPYRASKDESLQPWYTWYCIP
jgi:hypothetical protein